MLARLSLILLLIFFALHTLSAQSDKPASKSNNLYQEGLKLVAEKKYQDALVYFQESKRLDPKNPLPYYQIAQIYQAQKKYHSAIKYYKKLIDILEPVKNQQQTLSVIYNELGNIYHKQGQYKEALEYYGKSVNYLKKQKDARKLAVLYNNIGSVYQSMNQDDNALAYYSKALKIDIRYKEVKYIAIDYNNLGFIYKRKEDFVQAIKYYNKALKNLKKLSVNKETAITYNNLGEIYKTQNNNLLAMEYFEKSLEILKALDTSNEIAMVYNNIAGLYFSEDKFENALYYYQLCINEAEKNPLNYNLVNYYQNLAHFYLNQNKKEKAYFIYHKLYHHYLRLNLNPQAKQIFDILEKLKLEVKYNFLEADEKKDLAILFNNIGYIHKTQNEYQLALQYYLQALDIFELMSKDNLSARVYLNIGDVYFAQQNNEKARSFYFKALKLSKRERNYFQSEVYTALGHYYLEEEDFNQAYYYFQMSLQINTSLKLTTETAIDYSNLGKVLFNQASYDSALTQYIAAYKVCDPEDSEFRAGLYNNFAELYIARKEYEKASIFIKRSINLRDDEKASGTGISFYYYGLLYMQTEDMITAKSYFLKAQDIFIEHQQRQELIKVERKLKEIDEIESKKDDD